MVVCHLKKELHARCIHNEYVYLRFHSQWDIVLGLGKYLREN